MVLFTAHTVHAVDLLAFLIACYESIFLSGINDLAFTVNALGKTVICEANIRLQICHIDLVAILARSLRKLDSIREGALSRHRDTFSNRGKALYLD